MIAALKLPPKTNSEVVISQQSTSFNSQQDENVSHDLDQQFDEEAESDILDFENMESITETVYDTLSELNNSCAASNGCLAHLLQLAIKDSLKKNEFASKLLDKVGKIVSFFGRSAMWTDELKKSSNGLGLVKPIDVRWNSSYLCIKRILYSTEKVINQQLELSLIINTINDSKQSRLFSVFYG